MSELKKIVLLFGIMLLMVACGGKSSGSGDSGAKGWLRKIVEIHEVRS